jgi:hypothetical protein
MSKQNKKYQWTGDSIKEVALNNNKLYNNNMSKVKLNISNRYWANQILVGDGSPAMPGFKGKLDDLTFVMEDIKNIFITKEEWDQAERAEAIAGKDKDGNEIKQITWKDDKGPIKEIELSEAGAKFIEKFIADKNASGEATLGDIKFLELSKKLS